MRRYDASEMDVHEAEGKGVQGLKASDNLFLSF